MHPYSVLSAVNSAAFTRYLDIYIFYCTFRGTFYSEKLDIFGRIGIQYKVIFLIREVGAIFFFFKYQLLHECPWKR